MTVMLYNYIKYKGYDIIVEQNEKTTFADEENISSWAKEAVDVFQRAGIINGKPGNIFDPKGIATRVEAAAIFTKFIASLTGVR